MTDTLRPACQDQQPIIEPLTPEEQLQAAVAKGVKSLVGEYIEYISGDIDRFTAHFVQISPLHVATEAALRERIGIRKHPVYPEHAITAEGIGLYVARSTVTYEGQDPMELDITYSTEEIKPAVQQPTAAVQA